MQWLIDTFSANSDKARLVTIMLSAVIAVLVLLLNQWFSLRKSKTEYLIGKIEELFEASTEYTHASVKILDALHEQEKEKAYGYFDAPREELGQINLAITKIEMICLLYFPSEKFSSDKLYTNNMPLIAIASQYEEISVEAIRSAYKESVKNIHDTRQYMDDFCKMLISKYGYKI